MHRFMSTKSGSIYLHKDIRAIIYYKSDLDAAASNSEMPYEMKCVMQHPNEPIYSSRTIGQGQENHPNPSLIASATN